MSEKTTRGYTALPLAKTVICDDFSVTVTVVNQPHEAAINSCQLQPITNGVMETVHKLSYGEWRIKSSQDTKLTTQKGVATCYRVEN